MLAEKRIARFYVARKRRKVEKKESKPAHTDQTIENVWETLRKLLSSKHTTVWQNAQEQFAPLRASIYTGCW